MRGDPGPEASREEMTLQAVGIIRSPLLNPCLQADAHSLTLRDDPARVREQARAFEETVAEIEVHPEREALLDGVEAFSHLLVLYWAHKVPPEARSLERVHPIGREDLPLQGIFATCSPARPNPILVNAVRLVERRGNVLRVTGLEAVDGTPLLDIKPYVPMYYRVENPRLADWMNRIIRDLARG